VAVAAGEGDDQRGAVRVGDHVVLGAPRSAGRDAAMPRPPKTDRSYRTVPLPKMTVEALKAHLEALPVAAGDNWLHHA
jgi:hypothetical protein